MQNKKTIQHTFDDVLRSVCEQLRLCRLLGEHVRTLEPLVGGAAVVMAAGRLRGDADAQRAVRIGEAVVRSDVCRRFNASVNLDVSHRDVVRRTRSASSTVSISALCRTHPGPRLRPETGCCRIIGHLFLSKRFHLQVDDRNKSLDT